MVIYKITNLINGKIYVGQTKQKIEDRLIQHSYSFSPLGSDIRKFGLKNFKIEVVEHCKNQNELNEREKFWIKKLNCKIPIGYNIANGGQGNGKKISTSKRVFTMRMQPENFDKIRVIAAINKRSAAMQIEHLIEQCISDYESQYGQIPLAGEIHPKSNTVFTEQIGKNNFLAVGDGNQFISTN